MTINFHEIKLSTMRVVEDIETMPVGSIIQFDDNSLGGGVFIGLRTDFTTDPNAPFPYVVVLTGPLTGELVNVGSSDVIAGLDLSDVVEFYAVGDPKVALLAPVRRIDPGRTALFSAKVPGQSDRGLFIRKRITGHNRGFVCVHPAAGAPLGSSHDAINDPLMVGTLDVRWKD